MAAVEGPERYVSYTAPEFGYPGRSCRVCGHRPSAVRLGWSVSRPPSQVGRAGRAACFCAEHVAEANRAYRSLKAFGILPAGG